jgi:ribosomal protein L15
VVEETVEIQPRRGGRRKKARRTSVVEVKQEDGTAYYYDDPELGGSGKTSWEREELEIVTIVEEDEEDEEVEEVVEETVKIQPRRGGRGRGKKSRRTSVVQVKQEDGTAYYYDDPELGGTGNTAWAKEELEVLDENEEEDEEEEEEEEDASNNTRIRTRRKSATARSCSMEGCDVTHRFVDGYCNLHRSHVM